MDKLASFSVFFSIDVSYVMKNGLLKKLKRIVRVSYVRRL